MRVSEHSPGAHVKLLSSQGLRSGPRLPEAGFGGLLGSTQMQPPWLSLCTGNWRGWRGWSRGHPTCRAQLSLQGGFSSKMRFSYSQGKKERSRQVRQRQALNSCSRRSLCHITHKHVYTHTPLHSSTPEGTVAKHHRQTRNSQLNGKPASQRGQE